MAIFKYTLPSGSTFELNAPAGTTQAQADKIFYGQVAAGTFVGYNPGDTLTSPQETINNFGITRLERGTAGVNNQTILEIISGLPVVATLPNLNNVAEANIIINQANYIQVTSNATSVDAGSSIFSQGTPGIGPLSPVQIQAIMAQIAAVVGQAWNVITQAKGIGYYGFNSQQLERAGYIKPGFSQQYCPINSSTFANPANFVSVMKSPSPWTGLNGVTSVNDILNNQIIQNQIQHQLMTDSYDSLVALGVIVPAKPTVSTPSISTGHVYSNDGNLISASALSLFTNSTGAQ
jgi:hypothetical protein